MEELHEFAVICEETSGATFTLTRNKSRVWKIYLVNKGTSFEHDELKEVVSIAKQWILKNRKEKDVSKKYTLYNH